MNPFDWAGTDFLILYGALLVAVLLLSTVAPRVLRPAGHAAGRLDVARLARLAGGEERAVTALATDRLVRGEWQVAGKDRYRLADGREEGWRSLHHALRTEVRGAERAMVADGLLVAAAEHRMLRRWATAPLLALAAFGAVKMAVGLSRDRPVGFLVALVFVTVVLALVRAGIDRRTVAGQAAVGRAQADHDRLRRAPMRDEMAMGVALFGTAVLAGSEFGAFHDWRRPSSDGGGSDGGGGDSSSDGGGCGGGGCGGCGGGGD